MLVRVRTAAAATEPSAEWASLPSLWKDGQIPNWTCEPYKDSQRMRRCFKIIIGIDGLSWLVHPNFSLLIGPFKLCFLMIGPWKPFSLLIGPFKLFSLLIGSAKLLSLLLYPGEHGLLSYQPCVLMKPDLNFDSMSPCGSEKDLKGTLNKDASWFENSESMHIFSLALAGLIWLYY